MRIGPFGVHPFRPRLLDALKGYGRGDLTRDVGAGVTVGIVALPLAMAFAIASGLKPEQGIFTAIIAGLMISALGGSNVQIGGPAGAFIVIVYGIIERYGIANLLISTALAGVLIFALGFFRLGALVRYIPVSIIIGFTNGIAVLIALSQLKDLLGLQIDKLPADFFTQVGVLAAHLGSFNGHAFVIGLVCFLGLFLWPRLWSGRVPVLNLPEGLLKGRAGRAAASMPGPIVALATMTVVVALFNLPVETIGTRFGGIPQALPAFELPDFSWSTVKQLLIPTLTIALLASIESLLCARVADNMSNQPRHDPNQELMALGAANIVTPFFGGMPSTGTIARTSTNVRSGARTPIAGIVHALTLLAIVLVAAPLAVHVPLAALAGILLYVAWNMGEWHEFVRLKQFTLPYRVTLLGTFVLTVVFDLMVAIEVGLILACVFFIYRMSTLLRIEPADPVDLLPGTSVPEDVRIYTCYGSLFFGAVAKVERVAQDIEREARATPCRAVVLEMHRLISIDTTGMDALEQMHRTLQGLGIQLYLADLNEQPRGLLHRSGFAARLGDEHVVADLPTALARLRHAHRNA